MARRKTPRKRLGHLEAKHIDRIRRAIRAFRLTAADGDLPETAINSRLIAALKAADPTVVNTNIASISFAGETFRPECCIRAAGAHHLVAVECKRLITPKPAKALWKEGLSQALLYLQRYKTVFLVLYDFTPSCAYACAFSRGNRLESRFAAWARETLRLRIIVLGPWQTRRMTPSRDDRRARRAPGSSRSRSVPLRISHSRH